MMEQRSYVASPADPAAVTTTTTMTMLNSKKMQGTPVLPLTTTAIPYAALVASLFVENKSPPRALERACALGGYVAGCRGATPDHGDTPEDLKNVFCS